MSSQGKKTLTVFTPTYNRAELLNTLWDSLLANYQDNHSVEWLVIDDGSTDATREVVGDIGREHPDLVRYLWVANGGKHRAINLAANLAAGDWVLIVDSDDHFKAGALQRIIDTISRVDGNKNIGVIRGLGEFTSKTAQPQFNLARCGDTCASWLSSGQQFDAVTVIRRSVLQSHPFPEYAGEKFMAESWLWFDIDKTHKTCFVNERWIVCSYRLDGLTAQSRRLRMKSPRSAMAVYENVVQAQVSRGLRARASANWWRYAFHAGRHVGSDRNVRVPVRWAPFGFALFALDVIGNR